MVEEDIESGKPRPIPLLRQVIDQAGVTPEVLNWDYAGSGTEEDPYVVGWIQDDPRNPMLYSPVRKWGVTMLVSIATLAVAFVSSGYTGGATEIMREFRCSEEVYTLGISFFVLGFAVGPLLWAPLSELFGRQILFTATYCGMTAFNAGAAGSQNITTLIVLRFFAGAIGSSPLTNAGGVIADLFSAKARGLAATFFAAAPSMGPVLGPIVGGFVGETVGWRWVEGVMAIFTGVLWIVVTLFVPETYPPVIQRKRAAKLSQITGKVYRSHGDISQGKATFGEVFRTALYRPWILLFREPIVFLLSIYMAIVYGTLYMLFGAFPIVFQEKRGWTPGIGGLSFLGVAVGMAAAVVYAGWDNTRYSRLVDKYHGFAPPEARLPMTMVGGIAVPIGMFWFAWTNYPSVHFMAPIAGGAPFGFGMVLVFMGIMNYLIDSYTIFAASVLAANSVIRSIFGAVFPLFTTQMYHNLGIHWASCVPAFLALACVPFPFVFYKYGPSIRSKCKYSKQADDFMRKIQSQMQHRDSEKPASDTSTSQPQEPEVKEAAETEPDREEAEQEDVNYGLELEEQPAGDRFESIKTSQNRVETASMYEGNPYDLDRVNTRDSFTRTRSRQNSLAASIASKK